MKKYIKPAIDVELMEMEQAFLIDSAQVKRGYVEMADEEEFD